jgi:hypothetical protein
VRCRFPDPFHTLRTDRASLADSEKGIASLETASIAVDSPQSRMISHFLLYSGAAVNDDGEVAVRMRPKNPPTPWARSTMLEWLHDQVEGGALALFLLLFFPHSDRFFLQARSQKPFSQWSTTMRWHGRRNTPTGSTSLLDVRPFLSLFPLEILTFSSLQNLRRSFHPPPPLRQALSFFLHSHTQPKPTRTRISTLTWRKRSVSASSNSSSTSHQKTPKSHALSLWIVPRQWRPRRRKSRLRSRCPIRLPLKRCSNQRPRLRFFRWSLWTMFMGCTRRSKARRRRTSSERSLKSVSFLCFSTFPTFEADPPHPSADPEIGTAALSVAMTGCTLESRFIVQLLLLSYVKPPYDYNRSQYVTEGFTKWACKTTKGYVEGIKTGCAFVSLLFQRFRCGTDSYSPQSTTPNPSSPLRSIKPLNGSSTSLTTSDLSRVR